jgi:hypothetical protein
MARVERQTPAPPQGQAPAAPKIDEVGFAVQKIAKIEFPEPAQIKESAALIGQGKIDEGLARLDPVFRYYEGFRDAPGSWWGEAAVLPAALSFLQIPIFYPEAKHLLPASTLGAGQAYAGMQDRPRAKDVLNGLIKDFPSTPEAGQAQQELAAIAKIEKALEDPK